MSATATPAFTYTLRQLAPRDALVFKSVMLVLQGRTRHQWRHTDDRQTADLMLMGDCMSDFAPLMEDLAGRCVIHISAAAGYGCLSLPLRISDVIVQLNRAGDQLNKRRTSHARVAVAPPPPLSDGAELNVQRVALTRWPEAALLQRDIRYIKLATALTRRPVSIDELATRTQFPIQLCQDFVDILKARHLLHVYGGRVTSGKLRTAGRAAAIAHARKPKAPRNGLIARIRSRLGMFVGNSAVEMTGGFKSEVQQID